jgi:hypothetical protein
MSELGTAPTPMGDSLRSMEAIEASLRLEKRDRKDKERKKEKKKGKATRGIETMFRTTFQSHNDLVGLADNKANMMISVNGLIISILFASMSANVNRVSLVPIITLMVGCAGSMIFGVIAARPRVTRNPITLEDVRAGRANLLFFGNFLTMPMPDYLEGMRVLMANPDEAYMNMVRNLYALGHILEKKFRLLALSYTFFLLGLGGAVVLFLVNFVRGISDGTIVLP